VRDVRRTRLRIRGNWQPHLSTVVCVVFNAQQAYRRVLAFSLALFALLAPSYVQASLSHRATLPFPDRAQHAERHDLSTAQRDRHLSSNHQHTPRVGARDVGKAAEERRWVGASPHLGMPKDLIDGTGNLAWAAAHSAYGAVIATQGPDDVAVDGGFVQSDGPRVESPFRLLGQVHDEDAELSWTRFRCFDADTGTWISTDPLGLLGGSNLYAFGCPTRQVDPLGLQPDGGNPHSEPAHKKVLNLGSGENPMPGAVNVDKKNSEGVDVIADAHALPFGDAEFDEAHAINPYGFQPVSPETARVMKPGAELKVSGSPKNKYAKPLSDEEARSAGFEKVESGPMEDQHKFGTQTASDGTPLNVTNNYTTTTYRRL
jgi:RHS repeat-associated protein